ncbi:MAG: hypothetical protein LBT89_12510 [Planctomycetaceae bacterium]|nr:hypothetical protein [Planctomycetaceae bacterium]
MNDNDKVKCGDCVYSTKEKENPPPMPAGIVICKLDETLPITMRMRVESSSCSYGVDFHSPPPPKESR